VRVASVTVTRVLRSDNTEVPKPYKCNENEVLKVDFVALFTNGASSERYDESIIWRVNGDTADSAKSKAFDCSFTYFIPQPATVGGFPNLDSDGCGDLPGQTSRNASVCGLTITCEDPTGQGGNNPTVKVPACLNWKAPGTTNTVCNPHVPITDTTDLTQLLPNPGSKCDCSLTDFPITINRCQLAATCNLGDQPVQCKGNIPVATTAIAEVFNITSNPTCGGLVMTSADTNNGGTGCPGSPYVVTRTYTLNDNDVRTGPVTCTQTFTVIDTTPPQITCPSGVTGFNICNNKLDDPAPATVTDNCDAPTTTTNADCCVINGGVKRTYTTSDSCGNAAVPCSQTISFAPVCQ
jgi:hypothetical protein